MSYWPNNIPRQQSFHKTVNIIKLTIVRVKIALHLGYKYVCQNYLSSLKLKRGNIYLSLDTINNNNNNNTLSSQNIPRIHIKTSNLFYQNITTLNNYNTKNNFNKTLSTGDNVIFNNLFFFFVNPYESVL